jgi:hypothetical protein
MDGKFSVGTNQYNTCRPGKKTGVLLALQDTSKYFAGAARSRDYAEKDPFRSLGFGYQTCGTLHLYIESVQGWI